jgi:O-antigen chain-terminating methyltransferase
VTTHLRDWVDAQRQIGDTLREDIGALEARLRAELRAELRAAESRFREALSRQAGIGEEQSRALQALKRASVVDRERISRAERTVRRALHASQAPQSQEHGPESPARERTSVALAGPAHRPEFDYGGFEERFRGSEEEIKERQRIYVPYFAGRDDVVDIGCGRGEFLELMRESGIPARGADLDLDMILLCREKGLDVSAEDAFAYLGALPDDSLGGIFAAQVIEHLHPLRIIEHAARPKLPVAEVDELVLETPNPRLWRRPRCR